MSASSPIVEVRDISKYFGTVIALNGVSMTLMPGDLIATGTPAGIGPLKKGDVIEVEVEGIGILKNFVS